MLEFSKEKQAEMQAFVDNIMKTSQPCQPRWRFYFNTIISYSAVIILMGCSYTLGSFISQKQDFATTLVIDERKVIEHWPAQQTDLEPLVLPDIEVFYVPTA